MKYISNIRTKIFDREKEWKRYKMKKYKRLKNKNFSIISSNCCGMFMYYDMGLPYLSPTINLSIEMNDFVKMVENLRWYMEQELIELKDETSEYPVGMLGDITIYFVHYQTFAEGAEKWEERKKRINWNNLFVVGSERDGCTYETIKHFDKLPYKNKVIFTHINYPEFKSAYYIKGFEEKSELGFITFYKKQTLKRRYLDDFNYVGFLNGSKFWRIFKW